MAKYILVALNGPKPGGSEAELEKWYEDVHMPDLKSIPAIKTARRYKVLQGHRTGGELWPSVAVYEIETDDIATLPKQMQASLRPFHPDFDRSQSAHVIAMQISGDE